MADNGFSSLPPSGRPTWAEVDLGALTRNYHALCSLSGSHPPDATFWSPIRRMGPTPRVIPVIKADAYGHGAVAVAEALEQAGATAFAVAIVEEALQLRQSGVRADILVLDGAWPGQEEAAIRNRLHVTVFAAEAVRRLESAAARVAQPARVQIKVDTGMNRLGMPWNEIGELTAVLRTCGNLTITGTYSHLAGSEAIDLSFAEEQIRRFRESLHVIQAAGLDPGELHFSNSGGMLYCAALAGLSARPGIALYGYPPEPQRSPVRLDPVLTVKTRIARMHTIAAGDSVGYDRTFSAERTTRIATLPIGYADGYRRDLGGRGKVIIRDCWAPVLGRVSMDLITVDVTPLPDVQVGDEVTVLGSSASCRMTAAEWADMLGTIPYEVLTGLGSRLPRIYR